MPSWNNEIGEDFQIDPIPKELCLACGKTATREALFSVGEELALIERYCDTCMIKINRSCNPPRVLRAWFCTKIVMQWIRNFMSWWFIPKIVIQPRSQLTLILKCLRMLYSYPEMLRLVAPAIKRGRDRVRIHILLMHKPVRIWLHL
jgi:hypothetical protein